jgi:CRISPR-associated protein Csb2
VDAVKIGEALRASVMSHADRQSAEEGTIPPELSGHDMPEDNRHDHAFYLPHDADGDGRIDRIVVHADAGLGERAMKALCAVRRLWIDGGSEWRILLEDFGHRSEFSAHPYLRRSRVWQSFTPYLHPWYRKKGFMHADQLRRECRERGLPEPTAERIESIDSHGRAPASVHFHRFRSRKGLRQPDTQGSFWRLTFPEPVAGPIALGFAVIMGSGSLGRGGLMAACRMGPTPASGPHAERVRLLPATLPPRARGGSLGGQPVTPSRGRTSIAGWIGSMTSSPTPRERRDTEEAKKRWDENLPRSVGPST